MSTDTIKVVFVHVQRPRTTKGTIVQTLALEIKKWCIPKLRIINLPSLLRLYKKKTTFYIILRCSNKLQFSPLYKVLLKILFSDINYRFPLHNWGIL